MVQQATESPQRETRRGRYWRLVSRFAAASAVATAVSQVVFVASYSLGSPHSLVDDSETPPDLFPTPTPLIYTQTSRT